MIAKDAAGIWSQYQEGVNHHEKTGMYDKAEQAHRFFEGDQWYGLESDGENLPMYNFIQPTCEYKIAMVAMKNMAITFNDTGSTDQIHSDIYKGLEGLISQIWENARMDRRQWDIIKESCISGEGWIFFYDDQFHNQMIDKTNVYLSDEQEEDIQNQQYIIIYERRSVDAVKADAEQYGIDEEEIASIMSDDDTSRLIGEQEEVQGGDGKCSCLLYLYRDEENNIHFMRLTKTVIYQPDTVIPGMTKYPLANLIWLPKKGSARGHGEVEQLIPNQIETNRMLARRIISAKMDAFGKPVYSSNAIDNPEDIDKIGIALEVSGSVQRVQDAFSYIQPMSMSPDAHKLQQELISITRDMASAGDAALGNINPENASGAAIIAARDQAAIPLNEQTARFKQFCEDIAVIWLDILAAYSPEGIEIITPAGIEIIPPEDLQELSSKVKIEVSPVDPYSKAAQEQSLINFFAGGHITFDELVELLDDDSAIPKRKLMKILAARAEEAQRQAQMQQMQAQAAGPMQMPIPQQMPAEMPQQAIPQAQIPEIQIPAAQPTNDAQLQELLSQISAGRVI